MQEFVHSHHQMLERIAEEIGIVAGSCHTILSKDLKMYHICQHIVLMLTQEHCDDSIRTIGKLINTVDSLLLYLEEHSLCTMTVCGGNSLIPWSH
jgi:hypothetical protein